MTMFSKLATVAVAIMSLATASEDALQAPSYATPEQWAASPELRRASDAIPIQRHPTDCTVYFIYNSPYHCAVGTAFSMKHLACVVEDDADCDSKKGGKRRGGRAHSTPPSCGAPPGVRCHPHPAPPN